MRSGRIELSDDCTGQTVFRICLPRERWHTPSQYGMLVEVRLSFYLPWCPVLQQSYPIALDLRLPGLMFSEMGLWGFSENIIQRLARVRRKSSRWLGLGGRENSLSRINGMYLCLGDCLDFIDFFCENVSAHINRRLSSHTLEDAVSWVTVFRWVEGTQVNLPLKRTSLPPEHTMVACALKS